MSGLDLEFFKQVFKDNSLHLCIGQITQKTTATDRSVQKVMVSIFPENRQIVARMSWQGVGPEAGIFHPITVNDLVLVGIAEGDDEQAFILARLTSKEDKIPLRATFDHTVIKALPDKEVWLTSDKKAYISKGDNPPTENLVLGQQLKTLLSTMLDKMASMADEISKLKVSGNLGIPTSPPMNAAAFVTLKADFDGLKSSPVEDSMILSDFAFTEKG